MQAKNVMRMTKCMHKVWLFIHVMYGIDDYDDIRIDCQLVMKVLWYLSLGIMVAGVVVQGADWLNRHSTCQAN